MFMKFIYDYIFTAVNAAKRTRLTINSYISFFSVFLADPIEQYDLTLLTINGYTLYSVYFHIFLIVCVIL